jgi:hypothetical protein
MASALKLDVIVVFIFLLIAAKVAFYPAKVNSANTPNK